MTEAQSIEELLALAYEAKAIGVDSFQLGHFNHTINHTSNHTISHTSNNTINTTTTAAVKSAAKDDEDDDKDDGTTVIHLDNGKFHVCRGLQCKYARQAIDRERAIYCSLSGRVIDANLEVATDSGWTGRSCGSADPDMTSGAVPARSWRNKRDSFADSVRAYAKARQLTETDCNFEHQNIPAMPRPVRKKRASAVDDLDASTAKRLGAPCVTIDVDASDVSLRYKKAKAARRLQSLDSSETQARLSAEAVSIISKLLSTSFSRGERATAAAAAAATPSSNDPRLENFKFVFKVGMSRYAKRCKETGDAMTLTRIHDVAVASAKFVKTKRKEAQLRADIEKARLLASNSQFVDAVSRLILALWNAVSITDFYKNCQGSDSFRPFASGCLFGLKRGLTTTDGTKILPSLPILDHQLPSLKSSSNDPVCRQLQASSHRGLCYLQRSLACVANMEESGREEVKDKLRIVAEIANQIERFV